MVSMRKLFRKGLDKLVEGLKGIGALRFTVSHSSLMVVSVLSLTLFVAFMVRVLPMRWGFYMSEFDPYYQYRLADHMVKNGLFSWVDWQDTMSWYPYGRDVAHTSFPGLALTAAVFYLTANALGLPITLFQLCVIFPVVMATVTCLVIYFLGKDIGGKEVGLFSAFFLALSSSYISRTSLGFFDDETIGIFGILLFFFFFLRSIETERPIKANLIYAVAAGLSLGYIFASWGASRYAAGIVALFVFVLILIRRYSSRLLLSYSTAFGIALFIAINVPYLGLKFLMDTSILPILGIFLLLFACEVTRNVKTMKMKTVFLLGFFVSSIALYFALSRYGLIRPLEAKYLSALNPYERLTRPLFESVQEHRPAAWGSFYYALGIGAFFIPVGLFFAMQNPTNRNILLCIFGLTSMYFASSMVRLELIMAPAFCLLWALALIRLIRPFTTIMKEAPRLPRRKIRLAHVGKEFGGAFIVMMFFLFTVTFVLPTPLTPSPRVLEHAYSPTTIASASVPIKPDGTIIDWLETLNWMRENLPQKAVVASWWDYGYWITTVANRTTLADNATFNMTQIQRIALMFMSNETKAIEVLKDYDATHVVVFTVFDSSGNDIGYGDEGKAKWMAEISEPLTGLNFTGYRKKDPETGEDVGWNDLGTNSTIYKLMQYGKERKLDMGLSVTLEHFKLVYHSQGDPFGGAYALVCVYEIEYGEPTA